MAPSCRLIAVLLLAGTTATAGETTTATTLEYPQLTTLEGYDSAGGPVLFQPTSDIDEAVQKCLVHPEADRFTLNLACSSGSTLTVDGSSKRPGEITFKRDKTRAAQIIEVACTNPRAKEPNPSQQKYALMVESDYPEEEIPVPSLRIVTTNEECVFEDDAYKCPRPDSSNSTSSMIRVESANDPTVKYLLRDSLRTIDIRLLNGKQTVPFRYKNSMKIVAESGRTSKTWPVSFGGSSAGSLLKAIGALLAAVLFLLLAVLLLVIGSSGLCGLGVPLGSTEIAAALALVMQYLCFSNFLRGSTAFEALVGPMKWVTLFGPAPVTVLEDPNGSSSPLLGDITDIRSAWGGVFWGGVIMAVLFIVHGIILLAFKNDESKFTVPHRIRFGNWEQRWLNLLTFPLTAAATVLLLGDHATPITMAIGGIILLALVANAVVVFVQLASNVANNEVCWIWNSSVRESGRPENCSDKFAGEGYWADVCSDQLLTQPVSRSFVSIFPYQWVNTVADIKPVSISHGLIGEGNKQIYPPQKMKRAHVTPSYPIGKAPQVVSIIKTRQPSCCTGQRLVAGLLRTRWLDLLFTYQGLTKFFTDEHGNVEVPLVVKTSQLSGPVTSGPNAYYYDGARIPFIRVAETIYKIFIGVLVGCCGVQSLQSMHAAFFGTVCLISLAMGGYVVGTKPYSRTLENWLMLFAFGSIGVCAGGFCYYRFNGESASPGTLYLIAACAFLLAVYACIVIFCVFSAVLCPPLHETRFLEELSNCSVIIMDPATKEEVDMPGYSKYSVRDLVALSNRKTEEPAAAASSNYSAGASSTTKRVQVQRYGYGQEELVLRFYHSEIRRACKTGDLPVPS